MGCWEPIRLKHFVIDKIIVIIIIIIIIIIIMLILTYLHFLSL